MKMKFFYPYLKLALWLSVAAVLLTVLTGLILRLTIKQAKVEKWVQKIVTEQTGGQLEFHVENFDVLHKIKLRDIVFTAPQTEIGVHEGGPLASKPLLKVKLIEIIPHVSNLWRGLAQVKQWVIDSPEIVVDLSTSQGNMLGLTKYRARKFPPKKETTPWYQLPRLPIDLDQLFTPVKISLKELLISRLTFAIISDQFRIFLGPLQLQMKMEAFAKKFYLGVNIGGSNSIWRVSRGDKSYEGELVLDNNLVFHSWTDLSISGKNELRHSLLKNSIKQTYVIDSKISGDLTAVSLKEIKFELEKLIHVNGHLSLESKKHSLLDLDADGRISGKINLSNQITENLNQVFPLSSSGKLEIDLNVNGKLRLDKNQTSFDLPMTEINLNSKNINLSIANFLKIKNFQSNSKIKLFNEGDDVLVKPLIKMDIEKFNLQQDQTILSVTRPALELDTNLSLKTLKIEDLHSALKIHSIELIHQKTSLVQEPLEISIVGNSGAKFSNLTIRALGQIGKLLKIDASVNCLEPCQRITLKSGMKADYLMSFIQLAKTKLADKFKKYLPSYVQGSAQAMAELSLNLPDLNANLSLDKLNIEWGIEANIPNLDIKIPFQTADFQGLAFKLAANGNLRSFTMKTKSSASLLQIKPTLKLGFKAKNVALETDSQIGISGYKTLTSLVSETKWQFANKKTDVSFGKTYSLADNEISGTFKTIGAQKIFAQVNHAGFIGGGLLAQMTGDLDLSNPDLNVVFSSSIKPSIIGSYFSGLTSSGSIETRGKLKIKNWNRIVLETKILFKNLSAILDLEKFVASTEINSLSSQSSPMAKGILKIGMIDGALPIYFNESIDEIKKWFQDKVAAKLDERIDQYLHNEDRINNLSTAENNLVSWKDGSLNKRTSLRVQDLLFNNVGLEEMDATLEVSSKALMVKNYQGRFLGARVQGSVFVPLSPMPERVKLVSHVLGLDSSQIPALVGKKSLEKKFKPISGNFHVDYFTRSSLVDGVFDLTSIGAEQMNYVLELVDPDHADPAINNIRRALAVGSLTKAKATINRGVLGLDLDVRLAGVHLPIPQIGGVNLSNVLDNLKNEILSRKVNE